MRRAARRSLLLAALIALGGGIGAAAVERNDDEHSARGIIAAASARIPLMHAIDSAEKTSGGHAIYARVEDKDGVIFYRVTTAVDGKVIHVRIDPWSGETFASVEESWWQRLLAVRVGEDHSRLIQLPMSLSGAVVATELATGGMAVEADFEFEGGTVIYEVEVAGRDGVREVFIDGRSGKVVRTNQIDG